VSLFCLLAGCLSQLSTPVSQSFTEPSRTVKALSLYRNSTSAESHSVSATIMGVSVAELTAWLGSRQHCQQSAEIASFRWCPGLFWLPEPSQAT
jgi:hypothetical protein